jgi:outer membrane protein OmpA-like peptidoglycan-associated protein
MGHHRISATLAAAVLSLWTTAAGAETFKIYFERSIGLLTASAEDAAAAIAERAAADHPATITLVGHSDTADKNGKALSLKRAKSVKAALLRHHLPADIKIVVKGVGSTQPAFATGPNVSEPLNRFVEVTY